MTNDRSFKAKQFLDNVKSGKIKNLHTTIYKERPMITEQELKDRCTPEFIKWCCEYAEGFEIEWFVDEYIISFNKTGYSIEGLFNDIAAFSTLIHRAVEGFNKLKNGIINIIYNIIEFSKTPHDEDFIIYDFDNYQPQNLTPTECACLHCLLDIFEEVGK